MLSIHVFYRRRIKSGLLAAATVYMADAAAASFLDDLFEWGETTLFEQLFIHYRELRGLFSMQNYYPPSILFISTDHYCNCVLWNLFRELRHKDRYALRQ